MNPLIVRKLSDGVLLPLRRLASSLPVLEVLFIAFKDVKFNAGQILGLPVPEFERLSRDLTAGFVVSKADFDEVLASEIQMIDGTIEFLGSNGNVLLQIECVDASQWELRTDFPEIETKLERSGFKR